MSGLTATAEARGKRGDQPSSTWLRIFLVSNRSPDTQRQTNIEGICADSLNLQVFLDTTDLYSETKPQAALCACKIRPSH